MRKTALTIAGSDSSGGAGIQADIKTMMANGVYAMSAITALTAQNTTGVYAIFNATPEFLGQELDSVFTDIFPDAVKIGMVSDRELISVIARKLKKYQARNIVVDPVMVATSGARLISEDAVDTLKQELFPLAAVLTPNIPEAEVLTGMKIHSGEDMIEAARQIAQQYQCAVLCKGGHQLNDANDLLYFKDGYRWFEGKHIDNPNTHGTGCTLSSAIAANLAKGYDLPISVERAKDYISGALSAMLDLGAGALLKNTLILMTVEWKMSIVIVVTVVIAGGILLALAPYSLFLLLTIGVSFPQMLVYACVNRAVERRILQPFERQNGGVAEK